MARTVMAVFSNPVSPEMEDAYNTWYDEVHIKELRAVPGIGSATRYRVTESGHAAAEHRYVALYELDEPPEAVFPRLGSLSEPSPAMDMAGSRIFFWEPVNDGSGS
jgi:hypothetical protein